MPVTPREFDGCLVGLCAGVTEEHLFHAGQRAQAISNRFLQTDVKKIGGVHEALRLLGHRMRDPRVPMTEVCHSDTRHAVEERPAVGVVQHRALAVRKGHRQATVSRHDGGGWIGHGRAYLRGWDARVAERGAESNRSRGSFYPLPLGLGAPVVLQ